MPPTPPPPSTLWRCRSGPSPRSRSYLLEGILQLHSLIGGVHGHLVETARGCQSVSWLDPVPLAAPPFSGSPETPCSQRQCPTLPGLLGGLQKKALPSGGLGAEELGSPPEWGTPDTPSCVARAPAHQNDARLRGGKLHEYPRVGVGAPHAQPVALAETDTQEPRSSFVHLV